MASSYVALIINFYRFKTLHDDSCNDKVLCRYKLNVVLVSLYSLVQYFHPLYSFIYLYSN